MPVRFRAALAACAALVFAGLAPDAAAQTLYKLIDKSGKVTYSETPPRDFDGRVIRIDIDPKANTATLPKPSAPARPDAAAGKAPRGPASSAADPVQAARDKLEAARKALQDATDNPGEDDVRRVGNVGGGTRPVPTDEYRKRLATLEENVRRAEEELRLAERNR